MAANRYTQPNPNDVNQVSQSTGGTTKQGTQTQQGSQTTRSNQAQSVNMQNISGTGLSAIDQLIAQLLDRSNISPAQLDSQAPLPQQRPIYTKSRSTSAFIQNDNRPGVITGYEWFDPLTGNQLTQEQATSLATERQAARDRISSEAGVTPGGTATQRSNQLARDQSIDRLTAAQGDYSKEAAFSDVQGLINQQLRRLQEENVSEITRAAEGAGTSQSTVRSLLMNDFQTRAAEAASALGVKTAVDYGNISTNFANVLENLTARDPVTESLINLLGVAKGTIQTGTQSTSGSQTTQTQQSVSSNEIDKLFEEANLFKRGAQANSPIPSDIESGVQF